MRHIVAVCLSAVVAVMSGQAFAAEHKPQFLVGLGQYDIVPNDNKSGAVYVQYRMGQGFGDKWLGENFMGFKPLFGGFVNADEGAFGFIGFAAPFQWGGGVWELEPSAGIGLYEQGDSTFLGGTEQFHLGLQLSARVVSSVRIGVGLTHVSNATILHRKNRGTNILMGTIGWEF